MFSLITESRNRPLRERSMGSKAVAVAVHAVMLGALVAIPLLEVAAPPAVTPTIMAFVAAAPAAPPPPPPPPAPAAVSNAVSAAKPVGAAAALAAPVAAPADVQPERSVVHDDSLAGVIGGVEGGVAGGVLGGIVGGIVSSVPPPPPPPPVPAPAAPALVRIGGQITAPALLHRVDPIYPDIAAQSQLTGIVILEAVVDAEGCVQTVKVLRSRHALLDRASYEALMQWRYSPLMLNGIATPFAVTVTFNFSVK
jgi:protein TonB